MPIRVLSNIVAAQIAAGEVVERPASVAKELLENALDAGATTISIEIRGAGSTLIRVRDNGVGITADEVELALERHATSKLTAIDDLAEIHTLGFRGEALHSIASVSRLTLTTCHRDADMGARVMADGGVVQSVQGIGAAQGTIVEVADLFYNVPARRKFLKSDATEKRHLQNVVYQYAMAYPDVRFSLKLDGKDVFHTSGNGDLQDVLVEVLGLDVVRDMVDVEPLPPARDDLPAINVYGYTTTPHTTRANRNGIHIFVNGRAIADQRLTYAVVQSYHTILPSGRYPIAVLMVELDPAEVDVNVHPTKAEVRFRSPDAAFTAVQRAVRRAVLSSMDVPPLHERPTHSGGNDRSDEWEGRNFKKAFSHDTPRNGTPYAPPLTEQERARQMGLEFDDLSPGRYSQQAAPEDDYPGDSEQDTYEPHYDLPSPPYVTSQTPPEDPTAIPETIEPPQRPRTLPILRVVGQISATYIITEGPAGMYLIDQHAAHERILYEQFMAAYRQQTLTVQTVLETTIVELGQWRAQRLADVERQLANIGFEFEPFGHNAVRIVAVPAMLADRDPGLILERLLDDVELGNIPGAQDIEAKLVRKICKAVAIKAGQVLSYQEMQGLVTQLERCENPLTCPHGRPTLIHMSNDRLEKEFGRT
jgi:DNA mismatch repair protein MutL